MDHRVGVILLHPEYVNIVGAAPGNLTICPTITLIIIGGQTNCHTDSFARHHSLWLGLYHPGSGERLPVIGTGDDSDRVHQDAFRLLEAEK